MVSNHVSHAFARKVTGRGVTVAEWAVMRTLYDRKPMAPSTVADEMGMTRGAVTKLADRLIRKGLLQRTASATDRRAQTLSLTDAGGALVPDLARLADRNDADCFAVLDTDERAELERLLRAMVERAGLTALPTT